MQRHQARLGAEADQREDEDQALEAGREARKLLNEEGFELETLGYGEKA